MRNIEDLVNTTEKYKKSIVQQELKSKKNTVAYVTIDNCNIGNCIFFTFKFLLNY